VRWSGAASSIQCFCCKTHSAAATQFLKLGAAGALPGLSEHFLIWDLDMVPLRPLPLLSQVHPSDATGGSDMQVGIWHMASS